MIPDEFRVYCGEALAEMDTATIERAGWIRSAFDDDWQSFAISGSPRVWQWEYLATMLGYVPDGAPVVFCFDADGGDLHGLAKLARAIRNAHRRQCPVWSFVETRALGGSFVAAMLTDLIVCNPQASIGGLGGGPRAMSEAIRELRHRETTEPLSDRALARLARGDTFHAEEGELLGLNCCASEIERFLPPWGSGFQRRYDE